MFSYRRFILSLGAFVGLAPLTIDMYLPALPHMAQEFGVSASQVQLTLAAYFIGLACGQAVYGTLADRFGRKLPLYAGMLLYTLASAGCALAPNMDALIALRFLQALGGCAAIVIPMAMVRDVFDQRESARALSRLMLVMGVAPILAPLAGAVVLEYAGWRAIFWVLALVGVACIAAAVLAVQETLPEEKRRSQGAGDIARTYGSLLVDRSFMTFALAGACASAGMFAYIAGSPFVLIEKHGFSPMAYSVVFGANAMALIAASQWNHRLLATRHPQHILGVAIGVMLASGVVMVISSATGWGGVAGIILPLLVFMGGMGFVSPNAAAAAMAHQGQRAGSASALLGSIRFGVATIAGASVAAAAGWPNVAMTGVILACAVLALLSYSLARVSPVQ
jgi:DHA1 family bicyclomycin/chloramphenicol resistance-like MFS transporter